MTLGQLRSRALRLKRRSTNAPLDSDTLMDEALEISNSLLLDLAGAELENEKLRRELNSERQDALALLDRMPIASVMTDAAGLIIAANRRASQLLNVSGRHLAAKPLLPFSQDRTGFLGLLGSLPRNGTPSAATLSIRPRERRPLSVDVIVIPRTPNGATEWLWFLTPACGERAGDAARLDIMQGAPADGGMAAHSQD